MTQVLGGLFTRLQPGWTWKIQMMSNFKRLVFLYNKLTRKIARPSHGRMALRNRFTDIRQKIQTESPIIVDGGAHEGSIIDLFLSQYRSPEIHAFEPNPTFAESLREKYSTNNNVFIHENALGAKNEVISFNILRHSSSSSIMNPSEISKFYHKDKMDIEQVVGVHQIRLDEALDQELDILKLDLQGYELEALKGAEKLLSQIKTITTEIEFAPLYEEQPLFSDIDIFLRQNEFRLFNLYELWTHPDGQLTSGDALYLNKLYF